METVTFVTMMGVNSPCQITLAPDEASQSSPNRCSFDDDRSLAECAIGRGWEGRVSFQTLLNQATDEVLAKQTEQPVKVEIPDGIRQEGNIFSTEQIVMPCPPTPATGESAVENPPTPVSRESCVGLNEQSKSPSRTSTSSSNKQSCIEYRDNHGEGKSVHQEKEQFKSSGQSYSHPERAVQRPQPPPLSGGIPHYDNCHPPTSWNVAPQGPPIEYPPNIAVTCASFSNGSFPPVYYYPPYPYPPPPHGYGYGHHHAHPYVYNQHKSHFTGPPHYWQQQQHQPHPAVSPPPPPPPLPPHMNHTCYPSKKGDAPTTSPPQSPLPTHRHSQRGGLSSHPPRGETGPRVSNIAPSFPVCRDLHVVCPLLTLSHYHHLRKTSQQVILHKFLLTMERKGGQKVISFLPNGKAFCIHQPDTFFADIAPAHGGLPTDLREWQRHMRLCGFQQQKQQKHIYSHPLFQRDHPERAAKIRPHGSYTVYYWSKEGKQVAKCELEHVDGM